MMAEDWDLFAIVRSCQSATNTTTTENPPNTTNTTPPSLANSTVKEAEYEAFSFPNIVQPMTNEFQELNQLFTSFNPTTNTNTNTTTTSGCGINPNSPYFAGYTRQQQSLHLPVLAPPTTHTSIWPHFVPEASTSSFNRFHDEQQQQPQLQHVQKQQNQLQVIQKQEFQAPQSNSALVLPTAQPQILRSRKRKSQQKKMVCHVTADNVSADLWAWRKYGQKPIKGSPHPRNYYRCSSSKGCAARKQVERSNTEVDMFIVTYTGDHTHPRPTHRNSLAGSTRSKQYQPSSQANALSSSSSSPATHSPVSTSTYPPENEEGDPDPDPDPEIETDDEGDDEADILLPNPLAIPTNVLLDLDHSDGGGAGCSTGGSLPNTDPV